MANKAAAIGKTMLVLGGMLLGLNTSLAPKMERREGRMTLQEAVKQANRQTRLEISVRTERQTYFLGQAVTLEVMVRNAHDGPIYVYSDLGFGDCCTLEVLVFDETGKQLPTNPFLHSQVELPPDQSDFIELYGDYFMGKRFHPRLQDDLLISRPGRYTIVVEYHSPVPERDSFGLDVWSKEMGSIFSKPVQIEVVAKK